MHCYLSVFTLPGMNYFTGKYVNCVCVCVCVRVRVRVRAHAICCIIFSVAEDLV